MNYLSASRRSAFTLIELLVVIGIIALLAGGLGLALSGSGNSSTALQSAQSTLSSLLSSARGQAALTGYNAALFVNDNPGTSAAPNDRYLRYCVIAVYQPVPAGSSTYQWVPANDGVYLPKGAYVVPPDASSHSPSGVSFPSSVTSASGGFDGIVTVALNSSTQEKWLALGISSLGGRIDATGVTATASPSATAAGSIAVSTADPQPPNTSGFPIQFSNSQNIRGISISQYGVAGFINDASGFQ